MLWNDARYTYYTIYKRMLYILVLDAPQLHIVYFPLSKLHIAAHVLLVRDDLAHICYNPLKSG